MTVLELYKKGFYVAIGQLREERDDITDYETLKDFVKLKIDEDNFIVASHLIDALNRCEYAEYYNYDFCMGTLDTPTPLKTVADLEDFCEGRTYTVCAHINSLKGEMDDVTVLEERREGQQTIYIVCYKGILCTAIFNGFNCTYYADDLYGRIEE